MGLRHAVFTLDIWCCILTEVKHSQKEEDEDENITCPYGYENCDEDDFESMCDGCKEDRGEAHNDALMDTYD